MAVGLRITLAGRVSLAASGVTVDEERFPGRQGRLVFAYLVSEQDRAVPRDELAEALWQETPPPTWEKALSVIVSRLRALLGECGLDGQKVLTSAFGCYRLELPEGTWVDVHAVGAAIDTAEAALASGKAKAAKAEALRAASLARQPFLSGENALWIEAKRRQRADLLARAVDCLAEASLRLGDAREAAKYAEEVVALEPYRESGYRRLMEAHVAAGNRAEALRVYERCRQFLADELGTYPSPETESIYRELLEVSPAVAVAERPTVDLVVVPSASPATPTHELSRPRRRTVLAAVGAVVAVGAIAATVVALASEAGAPVPVIPNSLAVIDPSTNRIVGNVAVGARPGAIVAGAGALWVANLDDRSISRIDPEAKALVRTIAVGAVPTGLAFQGGRVWVATTDALSTIETRYNRLARATPLGLKQPQFISGNHLATVGFHSVWVADRSGLVDRVDVLTKRRGAVVVTGFGASGIAAGEGAIWVANTNDGTVSRIDPTNVVTATIPVGHGPTAVAVGAGAVWVTLAFDGLLVRIDPDTNSVRATVPVGRYPVAVAATPEAVWVGDSETGNVFRVDPATNRVVATIDVGNSPGGLAVTGGRIWVTIAPFSEHALPRGGTLEVEVADDPGPLDPALATGLNVQLVYATCAKLLNYPDRPAPEGAQLRPEVAQAFPTRSRDGKTYTFTIRPEFRFSPPSNEAVTAQTFKESIERVADPRMRSNAGAFLADVAGAPAFLAGHAKEITGIVARGNTLSFHLTEPSGSLPARLAMPFFCAVPRGTPPDPDGVPAIPSAGPYYVDAYVPGHRIVLKRNPNYDGERPRRPAFIRVAIGVDAPHETADVEAGRADYAAGGIPAELRERIQRQYGRAGRGQRYVENPTQGLRYIVLNTSRPLFADLSLRRAASYAVDRTSLAALQRRFFQAKTFTGGGPTADYLPPQLRLSRRELYPTRPDLATARKLAAGKHGTAVFYTCNTPPCPQQAAVVKRDLAQIGIDVVVHELPKPVMFERAARPDAPYDLMLLGWAPDFFDPAQMLAIVDPAASAAEGNYSRFHDVGFDRRLRAADRLTGPDRSRAYDVLARDLARVAPIIAYGNDLDGDFFSARVSCRVHNPVYGTDLASLCIRPSSG